METGAVETDGEQISWGKLLGTSLLLGSLRGLWGGALLLLLWLRSRRFAPSVPFFPRDSNQAQISAMRGYMFLQEKRSEGEQKRQEPRKASVVTRMKESAIAQRIARREEQAAELAAKNVKDKLRLRAKQRKEHQQRLGRILRQMEQLGLTSLDEAVLGGLLLDARDRMALPGQQDRWQARAQQESLVSEARDA
jgi:hypothetical protein